MSLRSLINRLKKFDTEKELLSVVKQNELVLTDLNTQDQLFQKGINSKGTSLPGPYAPFTIEYKRFRGQPTDRITLRDSGDFYEGFFVNATKFPIEIDSRDSKRNDLVQEWGVDIFGLTDSSQSEFNKHILPDVQKAFRKVIGL
jgi:hypothetical protein